MFKVIKSHELLEIIDQKNVISLSELADNQHLQAVFVAKPASVSRRRIIDTISILARQGFVSVGQLDGEKIYKLSARGKYQLASYQINKVGIPRPARWSKTWYFVTFDIPESQKVARNSLITHLKNQNFYNYTKGVWVLPYNPRHFLDKLADHLKLTGRIKIIEANRIDDEAKLKRHFRLK